jgi:hypothetical protein
MSGGRRPTGRADHRKSALAGSAALRVSAAATTSVSGMAKNYTAGLSNVSQLLMRFTRCHYLTILLSLNPSADQPQ